MHRLLPRGWRGYQTRLSVLIAFMLLVPLRAVFAGSQLIGQINAAGGYISGIDFDDVAPGKPMVTRGSSGEIVYRLNPANAATLQSYALPASNTARSMDYIGSGTFYQTRAQPSALYIVNPFTSASTIVGTNLGGVTYNFVDIALDPTTGRLWMLTDQNNGVIYEINRTTGAIAQKATFSGLGQLTSISIGPTGRFFISSIAPTAGGADSIFEVNTTTFATSTTTTTGYNGTDYLDDFAYDGFSNSWFGLVAQRSTGAYLLVKLTNMPVPAIVPEANGLAICAIGGCWIVRRSRRAR